MSARAIGSLTIGFGLVNIPAKLFTATGKDRVSFSMITPEGNRVKQKIFDAVSDVEYSRAACSKGYFYTKDQFVTFSKEELDAIKPDKSVSIQIQEFVPMDTVDMLQVEKSYYLKPDKGGDKGYKLLSEVMEAKNIAAVGKYILRDNENLVIIRAYKGGLMLHYLYYKNEVRDFEDNCPVMPFSDDEKRMAFHLVESLTSESFDGDKYRDDFTDRVRLAVDKKIAGEDISVSTSAKPSSIDLFAALKASLEVDKAGKPTNSGVVDSGTSAPAKKTAKKRVTKKVAKTSKKKTVT